MRYRNPFKKILEKYRSLAFSERDKGDRFERLIQAYLQTDKQYADRLTNVWLWDEFPSKNGYSLFRLPRISGGYLKKNHCGKATTGDQYGDIFVDRTTGDEEACAEAG